MRALDHTVHDGKPIDWITHAALLEVEMDLGYRLTILQGIGGAPASGGTHIKGRAVDLSPWDHERKVRALRKRGFAAWYRPRLFQNGRLVWNAHVHAVLITGNNEGAAQAALDQIADYRNKRSGLASNLPDLTWHPFPIPVYRWPGTAAALALEKKAHDLLDPKPKPKPMPTTSGLRVDGIDLSHHNKVTMQGLSKARELGVRYVYLKSTEGATIKDPLYLTRRNMVRDVDLLVGAYHFARPDRDGRDGAKEAQFFLETAKPAAGDLLPVLDLEDANKLSKAQLTAWVGDFVSVVKKTLGVAPVIYTPFDLDNNFGCKLWVARYSDTNAAPRVPKPWVGWDMRQFSDGKLGKPNQIAGMHVDLNTLGADRGADLTALRIPVKPKPKPPRLHRTLKISTFNLLRGRDPQRVKGEVLRLINQEKVDVLMLQEASGYVDILRTIPGFDLVVFSSVPGQDESPILVRGSLKLAQRRPVQLTSDPDGKGPLMAGWITVTGGEVPAKWGTLIEVVQLEDEEGATFLSEHTPPTVQTAAQRLAAPRRWRAYQNMMASTGKVAKQAKGPFVIGADWNVNAETDKGTNSSFPRRVLAEAGMVRAFPKTPKRPIDYFGVKLGTVADVRALSGFGSDHPPVVGTLSYVV